jgi:hypothetical protein
MRITKSNWMLLALTAIAAMAVAAPAASAQGSEDEPLFAPAVTDLSVTTELGGACSAVTPAIPPASGLFDTTGGCVVHGGGNNIVLSGHLWGIESTDSTCNIEFDLRVDGSGRAYLAHHEFTTAPLGTCTRKACNQERSSAPHSEGRPWRAYATENSSSGTPEETIRVLFCVVDRGTINNNRRHCNVLVPFSETSNHRYTFVANDINASGNPRCELDGYFTTESTQVSPSGENQTRTQVEVNHL